MSFPVLEFALVRILIDDQSPRRPVGAGFLVTPRHLLTCAHVVNDALGRKQNAAERPAAPIFLDFPLLPGQPLLQAEILRWFPVKANSAVGELEDIAVLELSADAILPAGAQPAPIEVLDHKGSFLDDPVRMCGFPAGVDDGTYANGVLQGRTAKGWVEIHHQNSNIVEQGFSGTAVWAVEENAVCGMTVSMLNRREATVAYMIPALSLLEALPAIDAFNRAANPYRGLKAFREQDARFYFGRNEAANLLRQAADRQPFTAVIGASGSGKSSLVFAGLLPILSKQGGWLTAACRPKSQPFDELAACLIPFLYEDELERMRKAKDCAAELLAGKLSLTDLLRPILSKNSGAKLLLFVDQFEELFTLNPDKELVRRYLEVLLAAGQSEGFAVLVTMRADFLGAAIAYDLLAEAMNKHRPIMIPPMSGQGLREAVERPALLLHVRFEPGLAELIVQDVGNEPGSLPLLEFCLSQLWEKQQRRQITHEAYKELGGVQQALAVHAEAMSKDFDEQQVRQIFLKLVRPGQGTEDTRQVTALAEFQEAQRGLIRQLADRRLLVTSGDEAGQQVEVAHEALIRHWQTLKVWVNEDREFLNWKEKLRMLLRQWQESSHDEGALLRGFPLDEALQWWVSHEEYVAKAEQQFIEASEQLRKQEQTEREAERQEREKLFLKANYNLAKAYEEKAWNARKIANKEGTKAYKKAVLLASAALEQNVNPSLSALELSSVSSLFAPEAFNVALAELAILQAHESSVRSASFSSDGRRIVSASDDKTLWLWDAESGQKIAALKGHEDNVRSASFSPDGRRIVSASKDKTLRLWDAESGQELAVLNGHRYAVNSVSFSPDGRRIVSASSDKTVRLWEAESGQELAVLNGHEGGVSSVSFSPDGRRVVSASSDKTVRLWEVESGQELAVLNGHKERVSSVSFSPDGRRIVSASDDKTVRLWKAKSGQELTVLNGHEDNVNSVAFSPDSRRIVSASSDKTVRLWEAESGQELAVLKGHKDNISSASFSPDGRRIVSASIDKMVRLWDAKSGQEPTVLKGHRSAVNGVSFSPDGRRIVSASDKTLRLWETESGQELAVLNGHEAWVRSASFSPDGRRIVSASSDKTVRLWEAKSGKELAVLNGHESNVISASFSPDGRRIVSASDDKTVRLWEAKSGQELAVLNGHKAWVRSASFSPDGRRIVSASFDKTLRLWDAESGQELAVLKGHEEKVSSVSFSPDGRRIASASFDKTLRIWDAESGQELAVLKGHKYAVNSASFSPDGRRIISASMDKMVRLWDAESGQKLAVLKGHEHAVKSASFSPDGRRIVSASDDKTVRLWDVRPYILFLHDNKPTPLYFTFIKAVKFLWQLDVQGLEIVHKERTPADMGRFGSLLAPPPPGQSKFDQVLEWAEKQQAQ